MSNLPLQVNSWVALISLGLLGLFAIIGIFDKVSNAKREAGNAADDRLINLQQGQINALERKIKEVEVELMHLKSVNQDLMLKNADYVQLLQGRDPQTTEMQAAAAVAFQQINSILTTVVSNQQNIADLIDLMKVFVKAQNIDYKPRAKTQ